MNTPLLSRKETSLQPDDVEKVACSVCQKEIPLSAAFTPEGMDYVGEFCGIECYEQFVLQSKLNSGNVPK